MVTVIAAVAMRSKRPITSRPPPGKRVVSHLTIHCRNLEQSLQFYLAMGFLPVSTRSDDDSMILLSLPKGLQYAPYLLLKQLQTTTSSSTSNDDDWQCTMAGYGRMALLVPSVTESLHHLQKTLGLEPIAKPVTDHTMDRQGVPQALITIGAWKDPDGTVVELVETHDPIMRRFLYVMRALGACEYPLWIHCNINTTHFNQSFKAYRQIGFEMATDHGQVKNKLYQSLGIPDPGIARQVGMIKMRDDFFQVDLIEWEDPKTVVPKCGVRTMGLTSMAVVLPKDDRIDRVPVGWEAKEAAREVVLPEPLGRARVKSLLDPDGVQVEIIEYIS